MRQNMNYWKIILDAMDSNGYVLGVDLGKKLGTKSAGSAAWGPINKGFVKDGKLIKYKKSPQTWHGAPVAYVLPEKKKAFESAYPDFRLM